MTGLTRYSDTAGTDEVLATSYTYDNANNLTAISDQLTGHHGGGLVLLHPRRRRAG